MQLTSKRVPVNTLTSSRRMVRALDRERRKHTAKKMTSHWVRRQAVVGHRHCQPPRPQAPKRPHAQRRRMLRTGLALALLSPIHTCQSGC